MANKKALRLIALGLHPVLLGSSGDNLKRPLLKGWQTAVYTAADVRPWPPRNNIGIRCGLQRDGRVLIVFDFDEEASRVFPAWYRQASKLVPCRPVIVASARGYHVYCFTTVAHQGRALAGKYRAVSGQENGRQRLLKFIETLGCGRQVVSAGSRHPSGKRYRFLNGTQYGDIPFLTEAQYQALLALSRTFDERPPRPERHTAAEPLTLTGELAGIQNCLDYARRTLGAAEQVERNGDIRFLGQGGLLVTADGRGWYSFSDETGGGLAELIAWHQSLGGEGAC